jgi:hypothetical protein
VSLCRERESQEPTDMDDLWEMIVKLRQEHEEAWDAIATKAIC